MTLENTLTAIAEKLLPTCASVSNALANVCKNSAEDNGISLSLQSQYGPLLRAARSPALCQKTISTDPLMSLLHSVLEGEERIAMVFGKKEWELASCFSVVGMAFFPVINLPAPPFELRWMRYELLAALDCFSLQSKQIIETYCKSLINNDLPKSNSTGKHGLLEKNILAGLCDYSKRIDCAALIDEDGFVLMNAGHDEKAEEIAGNLALVQKHSAQELTALGEVKVRSLSLYSNDNAVLIGKFPEQNFSLALAIHGTNPSVLARFLFDLGFQAFKNLIGQPGTLLESSREKQIPLRVRESWFVTPRLTPQGKFVYLRQEKEFHQPDCKSLLYALDSELLWTPTRAEAIRGGLMPCSECRP